MGSRRGCHYDADGYVNVIRKRICKRRGQRERELERERRERRERRECAVRYKLCVSFLLSFSTWALFYTYIAQKKKKYTHTHLLQQLTTMTIVLQMVVTLTQNDMID